MRFAVHRIAGALAAALVAGTAPAAEHEARFSQFTADQLPNAQRPVVGGALRLTAGAPATVPTAGTAAAAEHEARFSQLTPDQLTDAQKPIAQRILKVSSAGLGGPYSMLLRSPKLTERYLGMTDYLRFETSLPHRLNELAILIEARLWDAQYEWWAHYPIALKAGVPKAVADDIREGRRPAGMKPDEEVVYDVCIELLRDRHLADATFARAKTTLGEQQLVDLVAVASFYVMVSSVIIAGEIGVPSGETPPLPTLMKR
jgi:4-carboxymuconolactone decarboxylase